MKNKIILGGIGVLALAVLGLSELKRTPIELNEVGFGGYSLDRPNTVLAFYDSQGKRFPIANKDENFECAQEYDKNGLRIQGNYNVRGYKNFWGTYATSIVPSRP